MNNHRFLQGLVSALLVGAVCLPSVADTSVEARTTQARSAAPAMVSNDATIVIDGETAVEGSNGWVCKPELKPGDNAPVCINEVWQEMFKGAKRATPDQVAGKLSLSAEEVAGRIAEARQLLGLESLGG